MATAYFQERIERIEDAHMRKASRQRNRAVPIRQRSATSDFVPTPTRARPAAQRRGGFGQLIFSTLMGAVFGALGGGVLLGATTEGWMWGPATPLHVYAMPAGLAALALAPVLMLLALLKGGEKPWFSLLSLAYVSAFALVLLV